VTVEEAHWVWVLDRNLAALRDWWTAHRDSLDWKVLKEAAAGRAGKE